MVLWKCFQLWLIIPLQQKDNIVLQEIRQIQLGLIFSKLLNLTDFYFLKFTNQLGFIAANASAGEAWNNL